LVTAYFKSVIIGHSDDIDYCRVRGFVVLCCVQSSTDNVRSHFDPSLWSLQVMERSGHITTRAATTTWKTVNGLLHHHRHRELVTSTYQLSLFLISQTLNSVRTLHISIAIEFCVFHVVSCYYNRRSVWFRRTVKVTIRQKQKRTFVFL